MLFINQAACIINEPHVAADSYPATTAAYRLGALSAQLQEAFAPEVLFRRSKDMVDFALGFESIAGPSIFTRQFTSKVTQ